MGSKPIFKDTQSLGEWLCMYMPEGALVCVCVSASEQTRVHKCAWLFRITTATAITGVSLHMELSLNAGLPRSQEARKRLHAESLKGSGLSSLAVLSRELRGHLPASHHNLPGDHSSCPFACCLPMVFKDTCPMAPAVANSKCLSVSLYLQH